MIGRFALIVEAHTGLTIALVAVVCAIICALAGAAVIGLVLLAVVLLAVAEAWDIDTGLDDNG